MATDVRKLLVLMALTVSIGAVSPLALFGGQGCPDDVKKPGKDAPPGKEGKKGPGPGGPGAKGMEHMKHTLGQLNLGQEQKEKVHAIMAEHHQAMEKFREEHQEALKAIHEKVKAAREAGDKEAAKAAMEEAKALREQAPKPEGLHHGIIGVLNEEQKAKFHKIMAEKRPEGAPDRPKPGKGKDVPKKDSGQESARDPE